MKRIALGFSLMLGIAAALPAAEPPDRLNYQGVLRDALDVPRDGDHDMVFRFWSAEVLGNEILVDSHLAADGKAVTVSEGLFNVHLGGGVVRDGAGPGIYKTLGSMVGGYDKVWLEIEINGEVLAPRVRVVSAAYALNAGRLGGEPASQYLNTSATAQTKSGPLTVDASGAASYGIEARGDTAGGYFEDGSTGSFARVGDGARGISAEGPVTGGFFESTGQDGIYARGPFRAGFFFNPSSASAASVAPVGLGISAQGDEAGGRFKNSASDLFTPIEAELGYVDDLGLSYGIYAEGRHAGGYFEDSDSSGLAWVGYGDTGIRAEADNTGGRFIATAALGNGVVGQGTYAGGTFEDLDDSGRADIALGDRGIWASGNEMGGYFGDLDDSGYAHVASGDYGIRGYGNTGGGYFQDSNSSGLARLGYGHYGIWAEGNYRGGYFEDSDNVTYTRVANESYSIFGNGTKSFVQNHPYDSEKVVVYAALEGDEAGTYTRGTARLVDGVARVSLGETFRWVTNPDIGLTVHLSPVGEWSELYVEEKTTGEVVVRSRDGASDAVFDYVVFGLRIGFEETSAVRFKEQPEEAFIPSMNEHRALYEEHPELRRFNALERFKRMLVASDLVSDAEALDFTASRALREAIVEFDPAIDALPRPERPETAGRSDQDEVAALNHEGTAAAVARADALACSSEVLARQRTGVLPVDGEGNVYARSFRPSASDLASVAAVAEPVEAGDVLVIDPERPGRLALARTAADPGVFGIVAAEPGVVLGQRPPIDPEPERARAGAQAAYPTSSDEAAGTRPASIDAPVAVTGVVLCKVDAGYGAIRPSDLLTSSPTPGHAMRATQPELGTIVGKALEPLDSGTGRIKVLVMLR